MLHLPLERLPRYSAFTSFRVYFSQGGLPLFFLGPASLCSPLLFPLNLLQLFLFSPQRDPFDKSDFSQVLNPVDFVSTYSSTSSSATSMLSSSRLQILMSRTPHSPLPLSDFCKHSSTCLDSGPFSFRPQTNVVHDTFLTLTSSSLAHSPEFTLPSTINLPFPSRSVEHTGRCFSSYPCTCIIQVVVILISLSLSPPLSHLHAYT